MKGETVNHNVAAMKYELADHGTPMTLTADAHSHLHTLLVIFSLQYRPDFCAKVNIRIDQFD